MNEWMDSSASMNAYNVSMTSNKDPPPKKETEDTKKLIFIFWAEKGTNPKRNSFVHNRSWEPSPTLSANRNSKTPLGRALQYIKPQLRLAPKSTNSSATPFACQGP